MPRVAMAVSGWVCSGGLALFVGAQQGNDHSNYPFYFMADLPLFTCGGTGSSFGVGSSAGEVIVFTGG